MAPIDAVIEQIKLLGSAPIACNEDSWTKFGNKLSQLINWDMQVRQSPDSKTLKAEYKSLGGVIGIWRGLNQEADQRMQRKYGPPKAAYQCYLIKEIDANGSVKWVRQCLPPLNVHQTEQVDAWQPPSATGIPTQSGHVSIDNGAAAPTPSATMQS